MRVNHVEMALVHRDVDRLADGPAGMVQPRRQVRELHEVAKVVEGGIPASPVEVGDEGRAVSGHQDDVVAAERDGPFGVACVQPERGGRGRAERTRSPRSNLTRAPSTLAPTSLNSDNATSSPRNSMPISVRIQSA